MFGGIGVLAVPNVVMAFPFVEATSLTAVTAVMLEAAMPRRFFCSSENLSDLDIVWITKISQCIINSSNIN